MPGFLFFNFDIIFKAISIHTRVFETRVIKCFIINSKTAFKITFDPLSKLAEQAKIHIFLDVKLLNMNHQEQAKIYILFI